MKTVELPHTFLSQFEKDFKAEVTAAEMVEHGTPADRILILMIGAMKRSFRKDVEAIGEELSDYDHKEYTIVKTPREGIYDMLPEGLFHHPTAHKSAKTEAEIIKTIKQRREEERNARKFFVPFEATTNYLRMQMALYENRLDKRSHYDEMVNIFADHWEIFQYLDARQANIFLHLIPILYDIRDDLPVIETILEMIFILPVKITLRNQMPLHHDAPIVSTLGADSKLGISLTTGNTHYNEGVDEILIKVGPLQKKVFDEFMPGGRKNKMLELLCDYLLPAHIDTVTEFELDQSQKVARLADKQSDFNSVLGADTYL